MKLCLFFLGYVLFELGWVVFILKGLNYKNSFIYVDKCKFLCGEGMWYV